MFALDTDAADARAIAARIDRLPLSRWHLKTRILLGSAGVFDAIDVLAIAFVMPVLVGLWHVTPREVGIMISSGYAGQVIGASAFGWVAERYGRIFALNWTIAILSLLGLACALAQNYESLIAFRFVQGLGLGGELPIAATYVNEISKARGRGRFVLLFQLVFPIGALIASLLAVVVVPYLGWRWMFVIGALPALLILPIRRRVPESPRWLARNGRLAEADRVLADIELRIMRETGNPLPPPAADFPAETAERGRWLDLFRGIYRRRTVVACVVWTASNGISYGLQTWLPTILRSVYGLSIGHTLQLTAIGYVLLFTAGISTALLIDRVGRRTIFLFGFAADCVLLIILWQVAGATSGIMIWLLTTLATTFNSILAIAVYLYVPENFPTRMRALGTGSASACARIGAMAAPTVVGLVMQAFNLGAAFLLFAVVALLGLATTFFWAQETKDRPLEEISP